MTHAVPASSNLSPPSAPTAHPGKASGAKETIEQILVAFILAFIFRCFIVEAFVIPTGSMAPTLLGAHMNFRCGDCGYQFSINYDARQIGGLAVPSNAVETYPARCPNCGYRMPLTSASDPLNDATSPGVQYGDRILVQKYIYLLHEPQRWDVVVFKNPDQPSEGSERYQDNYIKRLTGLPLETLMVLDGDLYVSRSTKPIPQLLPTDFTVQTKPYKAQDALWRIVYDNDYQPRGLTRRYTTPHQVVDPRSPGTARIEDQERFIDTPWRQPWTRDGNGWDVSGRVMRFDNSSGTASLEYDTTSMPEKFPLTDWLAYDVSYRVERSTTGTNINGFLEKGYERGRTPINNVSDVKLALSYRRVTGDGELRLSTTKQRHTFTAVIARDEVRLEMLKPDANEPVVIGRVAGRVGDGALARIELMNADYRVSVRIDGRERIASTPEQFSPDVARLLADFERQRNPENLAEAQRGQEPARVSIRAANQTCELEHVSLWRDVYYLNQWTPGMADQYFWAMPDAFPNGDRTGGQLMRLGPDEFFVMGDNSMLSFDARCWRTPVALPAENLGVADGRVPRRFMLGRAFFVYWPAGFAPIPSLPAFVPNFGEMRFIH